MKQSLHTRPTIGVAHPEQMLAFSGAGFAPDVMSEGTLQTFPEANKTTLEEGVYGKDGMMPPPGMTNKPLQPGYPEGGTGGAGSFSSRIAAPTTLP